MVAITSNNCSAILVTVAIFNGTYYLSVWLMGAYRHFQQAVQLF
jgi:hypothetical protein